jgi:hypothetical protein
MCHSPDFLSGREMFFVSLWVVCCQPSHRTRPCWLGGDRQPSLATTASQERVRPVRVEGTGGVEGLPGIGISRLLLEHCVHNKQLEPAVTAASLVAEQAVETERKRQLPSTEAPRSPQSRCSPGFPQGRTGCPGAGRTWVGKSLWNTVARASPFLSPEIPAGWLPSRRQI